MRLRLMQTLLACIFIAASIWLSVKPREAFAQPRSADAIYITGKIVTADSRFSIGEALAVSSGQLIAVGKKLCAAIGRWRA
jgi:hypothetical protein